MTDYIISKRHLTHYEYQHEGLAAHSALLYGMNLVWSQIMLWFCMCYDVCFMHLFLLSHSMISHMCRDIAEVICTWLVSHHIYNCCSQNTNSK